MEQNGKEDKENLPSTKPGNLVTATGDDNLKEIFHQIRTSKTPVSIYSSPQLLNFIHVLACIYVCLCGHRFR